MRLAVGTPPSVVPVDNRGPARVVDSPWADLLPAESVDTASRPAVGHLYRQRSGPAGTARTERILPVVLPGHWVDSSSLSSYAEELVAR